ncbi:MAG TPA: hypothetical protein VGR26_14970 [Acidimicrobiales bacterium]|nr:hypothetical protein [Acidimicrobiales bacterium]
MSKPRTRQADELIGYLKRQDWGKLRKRMHEAIRRSDTPGPRRDGMGRAGEQTGVSGGGISDPTYGAAMSRQELDHVRGHTRLAAKHLEQAVVHFQAFVEQLQAVEQLASDEDLNPEPGCWAMARLRVWEPVHRTSDVGGKLSEARPLGLWAYRFVRIAGRLPTVEECRAHAAGRRVRVRVTGRSLPLSSRS